jgi:hypothetical protein
VDVLWKCPAQPPSLHVKDLRKDKQTLKKMGLEMVNEDSCLVKTIAKPHVSKPKYAMSISYKGNAKQEMHSTCK